MSANAARRSRRVSTAANASSEPPAAVETETAARHGRRRSGSASRVVAFPDTAVPAASYPPAPFTPSPLAPVPAAPPVPREEPAILHPSDRRSFAPALSTFTHRSSSVDQLAIGEIDQTLFDCPSCRRPLALGARRCPGCRSLLIRSVLLRKAALFVAAGALIGGALGAGGGFVLGGGLSVAGSTAAVGAGAGAHEAPSARTAASPSTAPATPSPTATTAPVASEPPVVSTLPVTVRSAFTQILATNARFASARAELQAELAAPTFDASAVATTLRSVSAQSLFGSQLAGQVAAWPGAGALGPQVVAYYGTIHDTASAALDNSVRNAAAYKTAAKAIAGLLAGHVPIDAAIRAAAQAAGETLAEPAPAP